MSWIRTDDLQWLKEDDNGDFYVINVYQNDEGSFSVYSSIIDVDFELKDKEVLRVLNCFGYRDIDHLKEFYGDSFKQIIAECLSEDGNNDFVMNIKNIDDLNKYLLGEGIRDLVIDYS